MIHRLKLTTERLPRPMREAIDNALLDVPGCEVGKVLDIEVRIGPVAFTGRMNKTALGFRNHTYEVDLYLYDPRLVEP